MNTTNMMALIESVICSIEDLKSQLETPEHKRVYLGHDSDGLADAFKLMERILLLEEVEKKAAKQEGRTESWWVYKEGVEAVLRGDNGTT